MKRLIVINIILSVLIFVCIVCLLKLKVYDIDNLEPNRSIQRLPYSDISKAESIKQTFKANKDALSRIDVFFGNFKRKKSEPVSIKLYKDILLSFFKTYHALKVSFGLYDENKNVIHNGIYDLSKIRAHKHVQFNFIPIKDSKDKKYCFEIKPLTPETFEILTLITGDPLKYDDKLFINETLIEGRKLLFTTYTKPKLISFDVLMDRISQNKPWFFKKKFLYILLYLFLLFNLFLISYFLKRIFEKTKGKV